MYEVGSLLALSSLVCLDSTNHLKYKYSGFFYISQSISNSTERRNRLFLLTFAFQQMHCFLMYSKQ